MCCILSLKDVKMDKERVPDPPRREELLDSQEDITEVEPDKVVNQNVPSKGQDTTKEKKLCDKQSLSENEKEKVKKGEEAKEEKTGGVSLCSFFYLIHVAEAYLNAMQTY